MSMTDYATMTTTSEKAVLKPVRRRSLLKTIAYVVATIAILCVVAGVAVAYLQQFTTPVINNEHTAALDISLNEGGEDVGTLELKGSITDTLVTYKASKGDHALDPTLIVAREGLQHIQSTVKDYTATLVKQERVNNQLLDVEYAMCKIRREHEVDGKTVPFSVYLNFLKPREIAGREVIYVEGRNKDRITAHEAGILGRMTVHLKPDSMLAMKGQRYPITEIGIETMVKRMIEKGERDREHGNCQIDFNRNVDFEGASCTLITITHDVHKDPFDFHIAKIYINDDTNLPIGYEGFDFPLEEGGKPQLMERYYYRNMKTNVGLTDKDFDPRNSDYKFPKFGL